MAESQFISLSKNVSVARTLERGSSSVLAQALANEERLWSADRRWAQATALVDMRQKIICGGGGCNVPYGTSQFWRIESMPCSPSALADVMFQADRYGIAQARIRQQLRALPSTVSKPRSRVLPNGGTVLDYSVTEAREVAAKAVQWAAWLIQTWRLIGAAQWSSNVKWWMVRNPDTPVVRAPNFLGYRTGNADRWYGLGPSINVAAYDQWGEDGKYTVQDSGGGARSGGIAREGSGADRLPPLVQTIVPVQPADFDPTFLFAPSAREAIPYRATPGATQYEFAVWPAHFGAFPQGDLASKLAALLTHAPAYASDVVRFMKPNSVRVETLPAGQVQPGAATTSGHVAIDGAAPLLELIRHTIEEAEFVAALGFGTAISRATQSWSHFYEQLPENMRTLSLAQIDDIMQVLMQSRLDDATAAFSAAAGTITGIVAAINPIAGAIVAVVAAVIALLIRFAQDVGLARRENPPCPPAPFVRIIPATEATAACDYDPAAAGSLSNLASRVSAIGILAARDIPPADWWSTLRELDTNKPAPFQPLDDGAGYATPSALPWGPIAFGGAVALALGVGAYALRKR